MSNSSNSNPASRSKLTIQGKTVPDWFVLEKTITDNGYECLLVYRQTDPLNTVFTHVVDSSQGNGRLEVYPPMLFTFPDSSHLLADGINDHNYLLMVTSDMRKQWHPFFVEETEVETVAEVEQILSILSSGVCQYAASVPLSDRQALSLVRDSTCLQSTLADASIPVLDKFTMLNSESAADFEEWSTGQLKALLASRPASDMISAGIKTFGWDQGQFSPIAMAEPARSISGNMFAAVTRLYHKLATGKDENTPVTLDLSITADDVFGGSADHIQQIQGMLLRTVLNESSTNWDDWFAMVDRPAVVLARIGRQYNKQPNIFASSTLIKAVFSLTSDNTKTMSQWSLWTKKQYLEYKKFIKTTPLDSSFPNRPLINGYIAPIVVDMMGGLDEAVEVLYVLPLVFGSKVIESDKAEQFFDMVRKYSTSDKKTPFTTMIHRES